ncbi:hypothetical protein KUTeg_015154 [Tegillarca granosa]|uniref:Uncharacterized protein n=1 Tax=Tegillarca granosa TaxID=220873 RepID=A0ABQ9EPH0_TEGGR|nr:hypothetical protein KUTeg_015154 [Tegillarca granosa]
MSTWCLFEKEKLIMISKMTGTCIDAELRLGIFDILRNVVRDIIYRIPYDDMTGGVVALLRNNF